MKLLTSYSIYINVNSCQNSKHISHHNFVYAQVMYYLCKYKNLI